MATGPRQCLERWPCALPPVMLTRTQTNPADTKRHGDDLIAPSLGAIIRQQLNSTGIVMTEPNIVYSGLSRKVRVGKLDFRVEIYRLEHELQWALEVVDKDGTSTVWDEQFKSDQDALDAVLEVIRDEGVDAFMEKGNIIPFPRKHLPRVS